MSVDFFAATPADKPAILELMRHFYAEDGYPFDAALGDAALGTLMHDTSLGRVWSLRDGPTVGGYLAVTLGFSLEYGGRDAFLDELFIADAYRGVGLGRRAIEVAEHFCREADVRALHLEVEAHRERARKLYQAAGFATDDRCLMTKRLAP